MRNSTENLSTGILQSLVMKTRQAIHSCILQGSQTIVGKINNHGWSSCTENGKNRLIFTTHFQKTASDKVNARNSFEWNIRIRMYGLNSFNGIGCIHVSEPNSLKGITRIHVSRLNSFIRIARIHVSGSNPFIGIAYEKMYWQNPDKGIALGKTICHISLQGDGVN